MNSHNVRVHDLEMIIEFMLIVGTRESLFKLELAYSSQRLAYFGAVWDAEKISSNSNKLSRAPTSGKEAELLPHSRARSYAGKRYILGT